MPRAALGITRVQFNIYEDDKRTLETVYGPGWSAELRGVVHKHCEALRAKSQPKTLGELTNGE